MTTIDTTRFRDALLRERERVQGALENLHNENPGSVEDETGEETQDQHLGDAATAMKRIEDGTFGTCTNCGRPISEERLEALPWAELCIDCARLR